MNDNLRLMIDDDRPSEFTKLAEGGWLKVQ